MKTILLQPEDGMFVITEPSDSGKSQDRHFHFVFPAPVCPDIETVLIVLDEPYTVSFEPDSVLLPSLSAVGAQSFGGTALERLLEVIDAPTLAEICLMGFPGIPQAMFQKTTLKKLELNGGARVPTSIPDDIKNLVNLEDFKLFSAEVSYLSPELFRLPQIRKISLYRLKYEPTPEVVAAAEAFVAAGGCLDQPYGEGPLKLGKVADSEGSSDSAAPDPKVKTEAAPGDGTVALEIAPFEADPRVLVLTYAADWRSCNSGSKFGQSVQRFRDRCNSGEAPLPATVIGAVFDAHASGWKILMEDQLGPIIALWKFFIQRRIPFVISGPDESVINIFEVARIRHIPFADSIEEAAGLCGQMGRALEGKDAESLERIFGSHREAFLGRNGRTASSRDIPLRALSDFYLWVWDKSPVIAVEGEASPFHIHEGIGIAVAGPDMLKAGPEVPVFRDAFFLWYDQHPELRDVVLDLTAPEFACEAGILLLMNRRISARGGTLHLARPQPGVRSHIELLRLRMIPIWNSVEEALAAAKAGAQASS